MYKAFSGPYFPVFSPNTGKYGPEKTPYLDTFHTVFNASFLTFQINLSKKLSTNKLWEQMKSPISEQSTPNISDEKNENFVHFNEITRLPLSSQNNQN